MNKKAINSTSSVSKGCFAFKSKRRKKSLVGDEYAQEPWYKAYISCWDSVQDSFKTIENEAFSKVLGEIVSYIQDRKPADSDNAIPVAALLVGVNMPDHDSLFSSLSQKLLKEVSQHVALLWSRDCTTIRSCVERMCLQFLSSDAREESDDESNDESDDEVGEAKNSAASGKIVRSQCTLPSLSSWYDNLNTSKIDGNSVVEPLIVIIPDVESFHGKVIQDFVLLLRAYLQKLPFFLVLGVATAVSAIHRSLPHHVSSCVNIKLFKTKPSFEYLSEILEKVFFTAERHVHLGGKAFELMRSVFLFYDFSVTGFIAAYKYCLLEHFFEKNWNAVCTSQSVLNNLHKAELEQLRNLPSARKYVEDNNLKKQEIHRWFKDDEFFKSKVKKLLQQLQEHIYGFYTALRCLHVFTSDMSKSPIGRSLESIYSLAISSDVTEDADFKQCVRLFSLMSRVELQTKLDKVVAILENSDNETSELHRVAKEVAELAHSLRDLPDSNHLISPAKACSPSKISTCQSTSPVSLNSVYKSRAQLKQTLQEKASLEKQKQEPYDKLRDQIFGCLLNNLFSTFLKTPYSKPFHEIMFYNDEKSVKSHIIGSPRQAMFRALRDPHYYLECECCKLSSPDEILPSHPDISIVFKLHLESGRLINVFDWLQSFLLVINPMDEEQTEVDPKLQARFTQAVAELQFLGFIKSSTRKTDHVTRITWG